jgi:regulator of protease activity HflC (stomatin/prohibitin superfamily)
MALSRSSDATRALVLRAVAAVVSVIVLVLAASSCVERVDAGHVGIRVKLAGTSRGVDDIPLVTGWVFYNPLAEQIVLFPTSVQNIVWTKDAHEGSPHDDSITFSSAEGVNINVDIGLSFHIDAPKAPHLYLRFRKANMKELANGYVRNAVREAFNVTASTMPVQEIYGVGKGRLVDSSLKRLQDKLTPDGFVIDQLTINGGLRLPDNVATAINRAMEATQQAIQAENRVRQVKAEAEQEITKAEGRATAARAQAKGEADAQLIKAKAEAKSNLILRASLSPIVLQHRALERWNGRLPAWNGAAQLPMLTFDVTKAEKPSPEEEAALKELLGEDAAGPHGAEPSAPSAPTTPARRGAQARDGRSEDAAGPSGRPQGGDDGLERACLVALPHGRQGREIERGDELAARGVERGASDGERHRVEREPLDGRVAGLPRARGHDLARRLDGDLVQRLLRGPLGRAVVEGRGPPDHDARAERATTWAEQEAHLEGSTRAGQLEPHTRPRPRDLVVGATHERGERTSEGAVERRRGEQRGGAHELDGRLVLPERARERGVELATPRQLGERARAPGEHTRVVVEEHEEQLHGRGAGPREQGRQQGGVELGRGYGVLGQGRASPRHVARLVERRGALDEAHLSAWGHVGEHVGQGLEHHGSVAHHERHARTPGRPARRPVTVAPRRRARRGT